MTILTVYPTAQGDDGDAIVDESGEFYNDQTTMRVGWDGDSFVYTMWVRFPGITIAQGATINSSGTALTLYSNENDSTTFDILVKATDADNAAAPTDETEVATGTAGPTLTTASETKSGAITAGAGFSFSSVHGIVQEIVNRGSWSSGNSIVFHFQYAGGSPEEDEEVFTFRTYDYSGSTYTPKLVVSHGAASSAVPVIMNHYRRMRNN